MIGVVIRPRLCARSRALRTDRTFCTYVVSAIEHSKRVPDGYNCAHALAQNDGIDLPGCAGLAQVAFCAFPTPKRFH